MAAAVIMKITQIVTLTIRLCDGGDITFPMVFAVIDLSPLTVLM